MIFVATLVQEKSFSLVEFRNMMSHLPEHVSDAEIEEMFSFADKNNDGRISWEEFLVIIFNWISSSTLIDSFSFTHVATN